MIAWSCTSFCLASIHQHNCHSSACRPAYKPTCMPRKGNMRRDRMKEAREKSPSNTAWSFTLTKTVLPSFPRTKPQRYNEERLQQLCKSGTRCFDEKVFVSVRLTWQGLLCYCDIYGGLVRYLYSINTQKHRIK